MQKSTRLPVVIKENDKEMVGINYGWVDENGEKHTTMSEFAQKYRLQGPESLKDSRLGVCWDQVELEREIALKMLKKYRSNSFMSRSFMLVYYGDDNWPSHTFLLMEDEHKVYYLEYAWLKNTGVWEFEDTQEALSYVLDKWLVEMDPKGKWDKGSLAMYEYKKAQEGLNPSEFFSHCQNGRKINIKDLLKK